jgi:Uma2 family endonuclease
VNAEALPRTADEFLTWTDLPAQAGQRYELTREGPHEMSFPSELHGFLSGWLFVLLFSYQRQSGHGRAANSDVPLLLSRNPDVLRAPDFAYFPTKKPLAARAGRYVEEIPTLVGEILSPNDRHADVMSRLNDYLNAGVSLIWVIDPAMQTLTIHTRSSAHRVLTIDDTLDGNGVLPGFTCPVRDIFNPPDGVEIKR